MLVENYDIAVVGGGFFGCRIALTLASRNHRVVLIERCQKLCKRASQNNQARIHKGYHYPRSIITAYASSTHYERFCEEFKEISYSGFKHIYAIARRGSYTTRYQFKKFCNHLSLPLEPVDSDLKNLFLSSEIEETYLVNEGVVNIEEFGEFIERKVSKEKNITVIRDAEIKRVNIKNEFITLHWCEGSIKASGVYLALYGGSNRLLASSGLEPLDLKAEIAEVCLVDVPDVLKNIGITVMDGMFFSCIPWTADDCHTFTHVRYTPHVKWDMKNYPRVSPYDFLDTFQCRSNFAYMMRDARRFIPIFEELKYRDSLYEVKVVPNKNEIDDGRPILYQTHNNDPLCVSVIGSKFDCIYDLEKFI